MGEAAVAVSTITREDVLSRARKCLGHGFYSWGRGGFNPTHEFPWAGPDELSDCSGFVSWCIAEPRQNEGIDGGWISTSAMVADAKGDASMFVRVTAPVAGDIIVYGEQHVRAGTPEAFVRPGHCGIISSVEGLKRPTKAIHCAKGNFNKFGKAVAETNVNGFVSCGAIIVRPRKVAE